MSETPRTDEHLRMKEENGHTVVVSSDFARQLEIELADAKAKLRKLRKLRKKMIKKKMSETSRTDEHLRRKRENGHTVIVSREFAQELEVENEKLRNLLDKASQALDAFVDLRKLTATELKSAHNGICVLLEATKILDEIKAGGSE